MASPTRPSDDLPDAHPRCEAGTFTAEALTPEQREVMERAQRLLVDMLHTGAAHTARDARGSAEFTSIERFLPRLDEIRHNHVVLIDGVRGSGKTSILLSLLHAWSDQLRRRLEGRAQPGAPTGTILPLGVIDLHPMHRNTDLVMLLVSRFHRVIEVIEAQKAIRHEERRPWEPEIFQQPVGELRRAWNQLAAAIASWSGPVEARKATLEPEVFTRDLADQTLRGLSLDRNFREFLDLVVKGCQRLVGDGPILFVVPIDDADMSPEHGPQLMQILRTFYHPNLAFVLTGDTDLFLTALRGHYLEQLWRPFSSLPHDNRQSNVVGPTTYAVQLGHQVYERVVPESHRCRLSLLSPETQFGFDIPLNEEHRVSLRALLRRYPTGWTALGSTSEPATLYDLFAIGTPEAPAYRLAALLPDRLRRLVDLAHEIVRIDRASRGRPNGASPTASRVAWRLWTRALDSADVSAYHRERLRDVVTLADGDRHLLVSAGAIKVGYEHRELRRLEGNRGGDIVMRVPRNPGARLRDDEASNERGARVPLPDDVVAGLMLATDLAVAEPEPGMVGRPPTPERFDLPFAEHEYLTDAGLFLRVIWPRPRWPSFLDIDLFSLHWEEAAHLVSRPDDVARTFVEITMSLAVGRTPRVGEGLPPWSVLASERMDWNPTRFRARSEAYRRALEEWFDRSLLLLLTPECGLPLSDDLETAWNALFPRVQHLHADLIRRRERLLRGVIAVAQRGSIERVRADDLRALLRELTTSPGYRDHPWNRELRAAGAESRARPTPASSVKPVVTGDTSLEDLLERFRLPRDQKRFTREYPRSLAGYLITRSRQALLQRVPSAWTQDVAASYARLFSNRGEHRDPVREAAVALDMLLVEALNEASTRRDASGRVKVTQAEGRRAVITPVTAVARRETSAPGQFAAGEALVWLAHHEYAPDLGDIADEGYRAAADLACRMLFDLGADSELLERPPFTPLTWWDGLQVDPRGADAPGHHWPMLPFPAPYDWERVDEGWADLVETLHDERDPSGTPEELVDALAHGYLALVLSVALRREPGRDPPLRRVAREDWRDVLTDVLKPRGREGEYVGARWNAFREWRDRVVLMAAPESGVSPQAAEWILDVIENFRREAGAPALHGDAMHGLREAHYAHLGVSNDPAADERRMAALRARRDAQRNHPWFRRWPLSAGAAEPAHPKKKK